MFQLRAHHTPFKKSSSSLHWQPDKRHLHIRNNSVCKVQFSWNFRKSHTDNLACGLKYQIFSTRGRLPSFCVLLNSLNQSTLLDCSSSSILSCSFPISWNGLAHMPTSHPFSLPPPVPSQRRGFVSLVQQVSSHHPKTYSRPWITALRAFL